MNDETNARETKSAIECGSPIGVLHLTGAHFPRHRFEVVFRAKYFLVPQLPFEYLLELITIYSDGDDYLFNEDSTSCGCNEKSVLGIDCDQVARDRVRHLRKVFRDELVAGCHSYKLSKNLRTIRIDQRILNVPHLNQRIVTRLNAALNRHGFATTSTWLQAK